ncbi:decaprenyl-phosphate phosphoribosyltransferase [Patescibacteria group bacterium]|nr:decaprenyl-phosphate phosphoribosyltransferase [Patescibacteria group bacterium]
MFLETNNSLYHLIRAMRPRQWIKNISLFAAITFSGYLFDAGIFLKTFLAFLIFCLLSSATYLINDIHDASSDKLHPIKKNRPIPSGKLSVALARMSSIIFLSVSLLMALLINPFFFFICFSYLSLQIIYTYKLRNVIILDALAVSLGFIFRVLAGGFAAGVSISSWIVLATIGLAMLLSFGKRRSERTILNASGLSLETRKTLAHYPDSLLDSMISTSASFAIISYSLFTFQTSPQESLGIVKRFLPASLSSPKWMMLTIPIVIYGVARYLYVIYEKKEAESPERVLLKDKPLLGATILWGICVVLLLYIFS